MPSGKRQVDSCWRSSEYGNIARYFGVKEKAVYDVISKHGFSKKNNAIRGRALLSVERLSMKKTSVSRLLKGLDSALVVKEE